MKFLEDKLEALDTYFAPKKESEKWLMILGVAGLIAYIAYAYLLPYTETMYKRVKVRKKVFKRVLLTIIPILIPLQWVETVSITSKNSIGIL